MQVEVVEHEDTRREHRAYSVHAGRQLRMKR